MPASSHTTPVQGCWCALDNRGVYLEKDLLTSQLQPGTGLAVVLDPQGPPMLARAPVGVRQQQSCFMLEVTAEPPYDSVGGAAWAAAAADAALRGAGIFPVHKPQQALPPSYVSLQLHHASCHQAPWEEPPPFVALQPGQHLQTYQGPPLQEGEQLLVREQRVQLYPNLCLHMEVLQRVAEGQPARYVLQGGTLQKGQSLLVLPQQLQAGPPKRQLWVV